MRRRIFIPLFLVLVILLVLTGGFSRALSYIQQPLASFGTNVFRWAYFAVATPNMTTDELEELIGQRDYFASVSADISELESENAELRELLGFSERANDPLVPASIISRNAIADVDRFVINVGSNNNVREGMSVVVGEGIILGKVTSTTPETATVTGVTHPDSATAVSLLNTNQTIGLIEGGDGQLLTMSFIPQDESIEVNDLVVTSGLEEFIPSGLLVGIVNAVQLDQQSPFKRAIVEPITNSRHHSLVFVISDPTL
jgi:rod shape-determining protein MreC